MPRVQINNRKYKEKDLNSFIKSRAVAAKIELQDIAAEVGLERTTFYRHLRSGKVPYGELCVIIDVLSMCDEDVLTLMRLAAKSK